MRPISNPLHAPDGAAGAPGGERGRFDGIRRDYSPADLARLAARPLTTRQEDHDDGLVHCHGWACAERGQPAHGRGWPARL